MKKLLKPKDILLLTLSGVGDVVEEVRDPAHLLSSAYESMYGFIPRQYKRQNFLQTMHRSLKTGDIEQVINGNQRYLRLTNVGKEKIQRDFPVLSLTKSWNKKWIIVLFDIQEQSRNTRDFLRRKLKSLGFGMLQQSVWITSLPIGKDMLEFLESKNLSEFSFVLEISHLLLGDPKELARRVWRLDVYVEKAIELQKELKMSNDEREGFSITKSHGRKKKRSIKHLEERKRDVKKRCLEFLLSLPPVPSDLLPEALKALSFKNLL